MTMERLRSVWQRFVFLVASISVLVTLAGAPAWAQARPSEYRIGVLWPLTGSAAVGIDDGTKAIRLAEQYFNEKGGIHGVPIKLVWADSQTNTEVSARGMAKLAHVDKVPVVHMVYTNVNFGAYPVGEEAKVFMVASTQGPTMARLGTWVAKCMPLLNKAMDVVLPYAAKELKVKSVVGIYENLEYGIAMNEYLRKVAPQAGVKLLGSLSYDNNVPDLKPLLSRAVAMNPDAIFYQGSSREGELLLRNVREMGVKLPILSTGIMTGGLHKLPPEVPEGLIWGQEYLNPETPLGAEFIKLIRDRLGAPANHVHSYSWKPLAMAIDAIKYLHEKGWEYTGENVRRAFFEKRVFDTIYGKTRFDDNLMVIETMAVHAWKDGKPRLLKVVEPGS